MTTLGPGTLPVSVPERLCASVELVKKGKAVLLDVVQFREPARAFVLRFEGRVVAYLNRCVHVPTELDWLPVHFSTPGLRFEQLQVALGQPGPKNLDVVEGRCAAVD